VGIADHPAEIEYHPYVMTHVQPVIDLHSKYKIVTQAYASLAPTTRHPTGGPLKPVLSKIASDLSSDSGVQVDESGVLLLWIMAKGGVCITSSSSEGRIQKMADLEKVRDLKADEIKEIDAAGQKVHFRQWVSCQICLWDAC
jgi:diketogulonate reductase-like aldo/keto reductase